MDENRKKLIELTSEIIKASREKDGESFRYNDAETLLAFGVEENEVDDLLGELFDPEDAWRKVDPEDFHKEQLDEKLFDVCEPHLSTKALALYPKETDPNGYDRSTGKRAAYLAGIQYILKKLK